MHQTLHSKGDQHTVSTLAQETAGLQLGYTSKRLQTHLPSPDDGVGTGHGLYMQSGEASHVEEA
jgi:hypothetical protein